MPTKEELQARAQLVRIHEANCKIEYPTRDEANFRLAIMKRLGLDFSLKELRATTIDGPIAAPPLRLATDRCGQSKVQSPRSKVSSATDSKH